MAGLKYDNDLSVRSQSLFKQKRAVSYCMHIGFSVNYGDKSTVAICCVRAACFPLRSVEWLLKRIFYYKSK